MSTMHGQTHQIYHDTRSEVFENVWSWAPPRHQDGLIEWPSVTIWHRHGPHSLQRLFGPNSFNPEHRSSMFLRNNGTGPHDTVSKPKSRGTLNNSYSVKT